MQGPAILTAQKPCFTSYLPGPGDCRVMKYKQDLHVLYLLDTKITVSKGLETPDIEPIPLHEQHRD
jgi:hypothetical protein